jgi:hypothetical protein
MAQLRRRFRDLSPTVTARIEHASEAQLLEWGLRVLEAKSLDDVFGDS